MRCPSCMAENAATRHFCAQCGTALLWPCSNCGFENEPSAKFCGGCGTPVGQTGAQERVALSRGPPTDAAERRQLTVMFCELVGSTVLSTRFDPEDLLELIGAYHRAVADTVGRFDGFVAKYMGDSVLTYFGYPQAHEDDAEQAVRAGLAVIQSVGRLPAQADLRVRLSIATGLTVVGDLIGEGAAQERGVIGETPNLAARLLDLATPNTLLIAEATRRQIGGLFELADLGPQVLAGFAEAQLAWQVIGESGVLSRFEALRSTVTALVGREEELDRLLRRWEQVKRGEGWVVLISGEPGIGKSRLTVALSQNIGSEPYVHLRYFCSPHHQGSALYPFIVQLERAAGFAREDKPETKLDKLQALLDKSAGLTGETLTLFADLLSVPAETRYPSGPSDPQRRRELTLTALADHLRLVSQRRPVLMVFEDAQWADSTSLELLDRIIDRARLQPVMIVITFRPEFTPPWVGQAHVTSMGLTRLGQRDAAAFVDSITGGKAFPAEILDRIVARTDGIPLFIEELTKSLLESGLLREEETCYALAGPLPPLAIPSSLQASLLARLDRLMPVKEVVQIGAALGREFSYELLAAVAHHTEAALREALAQLSAAGLVFRRGNLPHASYIFKHALVQDVAYSTLLRSQRQELHARIGKVLEEQFPETAETEPESLAHHFMQAGLNEIALNYWQRAGERALRRSANSEATAHLSNAIGLIGSLPGGSDRNRRELSLQMALGSATRAIKGFAAPETMRVYSRARDLLDETITVKEQISVLYGLWAVNAISGEFRPGLLVAQQALSVAARHQEPEASAFANRMMGSTLWATGVFDRAIPYFEQNVALYGPGQKENITDLRYSQDHAVLGLTMLALCVYPIGYPEQAESAITRAISWANEMGHAMTTGFALDWGSVLNGFLPFDHRPDGSFVDEVVSYCVQQDLRTYLPWAQFYRGLMLSRQGEPDAGLELMQAGMAAADEINMKILRPLHLGYLAWVYAETDQNVQAYGLFDQAIRLVEQTEERAFESELHRMRAELLVRDRRNDEAEDAIHRALTISRRQKARMWELRAATMLARLWRDRGRHAEAHDLLAPIYGWFTEGFATPDLKEAKALLNVLG